MIIKCDLFSTTTNGNSYQLQIRISLICLLENSYHLDHQLTNDNNYQYQLANGIFNE